MYVCACVCHVSVHVCMFMVCACGYVVCACVYVVYICACMCMCVCMHLGTRGQCRVSFLIVVQLRFWDNISRQSWISTSLAKVTREPWGSTCLDLFKSLHSDSPKLEHNGPGIRVSALTGKAIVVPSGVTWEAGPEQRCSEQHVSSPHSELLCWLPAKRRLLKGKTQNKRGSNCSAWHVFLIVSTFAKWKKQRWACLCI